MRDSTRCLAHKAYESLRCCFQMRRYMSDQDPGRCNRYDYSALAEGLLAVQRDNQPGTDPADGYRDRVLEVVGRKYVEKVY